jgi:hypothetical protein
MLYTKAMKKMLFLLLLFLLLGSGCSQGSQEDDLTVTDIPTSNQSDADQPGLDNTEQNQPPSSPTAAPPTEEPLETLGPDCYGEETHPIGQSIAGLYPELTDYEEVMIWFCNGFEFEDILTALQTSEESGVPAEELLARFEHGQTWDEIWVELELVEP